MKTVFVDTGAWYALTDADDPDHPAVVPVFQEYRGRLVTSNYVFTAPLYALFASFRQKTTKISCITIDGLNFGFFILADY